MLAPTSSIRLVSISVDPAYDTPEVLSEYASNWGADLEIWYFLTGPEESTLKLIREGFKITAEGQGAGAESEMPDIMHSTNFLLVDPRGWVRKIYHLDEPDLIEQLKTGIESLLGADDKFPNRNEGR